MKRLIACVMLLSVALSCVNLNAFAATTAESEARPGIDEILNAYHSDVWAMKASAEAGIGTFSKQQAVSLKQQTIRELTAAGYEAYDINTLTYETAEEILDTDFAEMNLDKDGSYIIAIEEENTDNDGISPKSVQFPDPDLGGGGGSFTYTTGGITYTMRYMTVTADYDPDFKKATVVNLLEETSVSPIVEACFNEAVYALADNLAGSFPIGTIASILGVEISDFTNNDSCSTLSFDAGTNWTRVYTQVYDHDFEYWRSQSFVEYARMSSAVYGRYYDASLNGYQSFNSEESIDYIFSAHYSNYTWRKERAAFAIENGITQYDMTGNIKYYYAGEKVLTHTENF